MPSVIVDAAAPHNLNAKFLLWNVEYEVNEGKRDAEVIRLLKSGSRKGDEAAFCFPQHDQCIVEPGLVRTKDGNKIYTVFTPFKRR